MTELKPVQGKTKFLLFRLLKDAKTKAAAKLALQTEHEFKYDRDQESKKTKDGSVIQSGAMGVTLSIKAISCYDDVNEMLFKSVEEDLMVEVWEIDIAKPNQEGTKYAAKYARGRLNSWALPSSVESLEELTTEMMIEGKPVKGEATLTEDQKLLIQAAYGFQDTTKVEE